MNVKKISHLGIAVENIEEQISFFVNVLGLEKKGEEIIQDQKVRVAFLKVGESRIELIQPISDDSPVRKFLDKKGNKTTIHHVAFEVDDLKEAIKEAKESGAEMIDEEPRVGAGGVKIAFVHPKSASNILTELCEQH